MLWLDFILNFSGCSGFSYDVMFYLLVWLCLCPCGQLQSVIKSQMVSKWNCNVCIYTYNQCCIYWNLALFLHAGVLQMECRDRFLMIAVDLSFTGNEPRFEAVGERYQHLTASTNMHHAGQRIQKSSNTHLLLHSSSRWVRCVPHYNSVCSRVWVLCSSSSCTWQSSASSLVLQLSHW